MKTILLFALATMLFSSCDLGSKANEKRILNNSPIGNKDNLEGDGGKKEDTGEVVYIESDQSKLIKNKMIQEFTQLEGRSPVVGETISYFKTFFKPKALKVAIEGADPAVTCLYENNRELVEETVLEILNDGKDFKLKTVTKPDPETMVFLSPESRTVDYRSQCDDALKELTITSEKIFNIADRVAASKKEFSDQLAYIKSACLDIRDFVGGKCIRFESDTELTGFKIGDDEIAIYQNTYSFMGTDQDVSHTWGTCGIAPYFSNGHHCLIAGEDPLFKNGPLHSVLSLGVTGYSRP